MGGETGWLEFTDRPNAPLEAADRRIAEFHALWNKADRKARAKARQEKKRRDSEAKEDADIRAALEAQRQREADLKPVTEAMTRLANSDHEVIKAVEKKLAAERLLEPGFVERREADRSFVRRERPKT